MAQPHISIRATEPTGSGFVMLKRTANPVSSKLDKVSFIRLNDAVTLVAFGEERSADQDSARDAQENVALQCLIDTCREEAASNSTFTTFPGNLPTQPIDSLLVRLMTARPPLPPAADTLLALARKTEQDRVLRNEQYAIALHQILEAARSGRLTLRGRRSLRADANVVEIPLTFLRGDNLAADTSGKHVGRVRTNVGPTLYRAIIAPTGELSDCYRNVELDRETRLLSPVCSSLPTLGYHHPIEPRLRSLSGTLSTMCQG
jgi:hypothetical protein